MEHTGKSIQVHVNILVHSFLMKTYSIVKSKRITFSKGITVETTFMHLSFSQEHMYHWLSDLNITKFLIFST